MQSELEINEISRKKASRKGQIEGDTKEERTANWLKHFQGLLGNPLIPGVRTEKSTIYSKNQTSMIDHLRWKSVTQHSGRLQMVEHVEKAITS